MTTKASTTKKRSMTKVTAASKLKERSTGLEIQNLPIVKIKPDLEQPRKTFNEKLLNQLFESIKKH